MKKDNTFEFKSDWRYKSIRVVLFREYHLTAKIVIRLIAHTAVPIDTVALIYMHKLVLFIWN